MRQNIASRKAGEIRNFATDMDENDVVLAADGERILGIGLVKGPYRFETTQPEDAPHRRQVEWHTNPEWKLPVTEGLRTTVWKLRKDDRNFVAVERQLLEPSSPSSPEPAAPKPALPNPIRKIVRLDGVIPGKLQAILERKGQAILYGPPGTGKTYWGKQTALDLSAIGAFGCLYADLTAEQKVTVNGDGSNSGLLRCCTFHPAFGYEDFIEGYRPQKSTGGQLIFEKRDGIFKKLCRDAAASDEKFVLLIDEINRGDIPRIFGELLTLLEKNKRGQEVILPLSGDKFSVPANVLVIGTMNTADRSIALLDTALRRRFGFVELMPDSSTLAGAIAGEAIPLGQWLDALNSRIREHIGKDARNLQIGHAYLMDDNGKPVTDFAKFSRIIAEDIIPLLEEYCYEDYGALTEILGGAMVDGERQRVREELFLPARRQDLIQALLVPTPELSTTIEAVAQLTPAPEPGGGVRRTGQMTTQIVNLTEWETREPSKGSPLAGPVLADHPAAQRLAETLTRDGRIEILELARGLELRASSYVGRFALGELLITIKPKISGVPLMNLLRYAYRLRHLDLFDEVGYATSQASFEDLLIHQLAAESSELLSRGLHRDYLRTESMLASPRGRIDFGSYTQVAANAGVAMPCVHYPRSEDTCLNQVLHGGLELAARMTLDRELGGRVRRLAKSFTGRITPKGLDAASFAEAWHSLDRRTSAYRPALTLIQMLLNTQGAALTDTKSPIAAAGFLFDMNRFFQTLLSPLPWREPRRLRGSG